jgi:hypothetical protein
LNTLDKTPLILEVKPLSQTMECVHLKEKPERHSTFHTNCIILYSEIPEQVIFELYLARAQIGSASVPEVTSMQVFECIGVDWKSPLQISLLEVCLPRGVQGP